MHDSINLDDFLNALEEALTAATVADLDKMLGTIRKLLAKAEDPACTTAEAETYTAKATELMARYGVNRAMLAVTDPTVDQIGDRTVTVPAPYATDKDLLLATINRAFGVKGARKRQGNGFVVHLFGMQSDLERVEMLFTSLLVQMARELAREPRPAYTPPVTFTKAFMLGYANTIGNRLRAAEAHAKQQAETERVQRGDTGPSVALVLVGRADRVDAAVKAAYPSLGKARKVRRSGPGITAGQAAGARADLGGARIGRNSGAIGGR